MDVVTRKINILLFAGTLQAGGTEKHFYQLICHLDRSKFNVHVGFIENDRCNFGTIPNDVKRIIFPYHYYKTARLLLAYCRNQQIDLIYTVAFETSVPVLFSRVMGNNIPYIVAKRGIFQFNRKRRLLSAGIDFFADSILTNSKKILDSLPGWKKLKTQLIYNGIDGSFLTDKTKTQLSESLHLKNNGFYIIGTVGRLSHDKGHDNLLKAFKLLESEHNKLRLILIGDGEMKNELYEIVDKEDLTSVVSFAGNKKNAADFIRTFDLFVLPSRTESFPNALLEAMYIGCPCVATAVGGIPELIQDGINGILVEPNNPKALADKLKWCIHNSSKLKQFAHLAQQRVVKDFSMDNNVNAHEQIYLSTIKARDKNSHNFDPVL